MSAIDKTPVSLLSHRVEVESQSSFLHSEKASHGLLVPTLPGVVRHTIEIMTEGLDAKNAVRRSLQAHHCNVAVYENDQDFYPIGKKILLIPETWDWRLWSYQPARFRWKIVGVEVESVVNESED